MMGMDPLTIGLLGSAVIGGVSSSSASSTQADANEQSIEVQREGLALQERAQAFTESQYADTKAEYERWKSIYGPLQEDLGTYYRNLTGATLSAAEVSNIQAASQNSKDKIVQNLAQSGRANSGLESYLLSQNDYNAELAKANARSTAEQRAVDSKNNFLAIGLGQGNALRSSEAASINAINAGAANQATTLGNIGAIGVQGAAQNNAIWQNYGNQLQGLLGYGSRVGAFGSNVAGTTGDFNNTLGAF